MDTNDGSNNKRYPFQAIINTAAFAAIEGFYETDADGYVTRIGCRLSHTPKLHAEGAFLGDAAALPEALVKLLQKAAAYRIFMEAQAQVRGTLPEGDESFVPPDEDPVKLN